VRSQILSSGCEMRDRLRFAQATECGMGATRCEIRTTEWAMTAEQWGALVELCAWLAFWGRFDSENIQPHSHFRPTQCPGLLRDHLDELRAAVHYRKSQIRAA